MVLADLGRKITTALQSLSRATIINEEVSILKLNRQDFPSYRDCNLLSVTFFVGIKFYAERDMCCSIGS